MKDFFKTLGLAVVIGVMGIVVGSAPFSLNLKERIELKLLFGLRGTLPPPKETVIVTIDRQSARRLGLPPEIEKWPRHLHARAVERLSKEGAAVIVFDLLFSDAQTPEADQHFGQAMRRADNVVLAQALTRESVAFSNNQGRAIGFITIENINRSIPTLTASAIAEAPFPLPKVPVHLTQYWTFKYSAGDIPTLPVVAFHAYAGQAYGEFVRLLQRTHPAYASLLPKPEGADYTIAQMMNAVPLLRSIFAQQPDLGRRMRNKLDHGIPPPAAAGTIAQVKSLIDLYQPHAGRYLNFYGPAATIRTISYYHLIEPPPAPLSRPIDLDVKGKAVFIGVAESDSWPQARDGFHTVYSQANGVNISGVEIAAGAFANLVENRGVTPPDWPIDLGLVMAWGVIAALVSCMLNAAGAAAVLLSLGGLYVWTAAVQFSDSGLWLPLAVPLAVQTPLAYLSALGCKYCCLKNERQNIREAFGHFLPTPVIDKLTSNINYLHDGGQLLYGICMITDAAKYTSLSETMDPMALTCLMNRYYSAVFEPIKANDGVVLQVIGDSVLAAWTAPHSDIPLKTKACAAAVGIDAAVRQFNARNADRRLPTRIGLHAGYILLGNIGAMDHFEYRPVGDIVNTASRLEGLNKYLGTRLLISEEIHQHLEGFLTRCMGKFVFIGKSRAIRVYELVGDVGMADARREEAYHHFSAALEAFYNKAWNAARESFLHVQQLIGPDEPSLFYLKLCDTYSQCSPEPRWDGTIYLKQK